jgi:hypothetical protein
VKVDVAVFRRWCKYHGLPRPEAELQIIPGRKFLHDFGWPAFRVVIEVQGGVWARGKSGHSSGTGIVRDMEKLSLTSVAGWRTIQVQPKDLMTTQTRNWLRAVLAPPEGES